MTSEIRVFDTPVAYQAAYQQPTGSRFGGDAIFNGENRPYGAQIAFYVEKEEKKEDTNDEKADTEGDTSEETKKASKDSIHLKIYDGDRLIRTLKRKTPDSTGIYKWTWYMNEAGVDRPSRTIRKREREPGGISVKPGNYRLEMTYGDAVSTGSIKVESDPRIMPSAKAINDAYNAGKEIEKMTQISADAVKQLIESKQTVEEFQKKMKKEDKEKYKTQLESSKELIKKIDEIVALFIGKEDKRQGIVRNLEIPINRRLGTANWYASSRPSGITRTEEKLMQHAKDALADALDKTNTFFEESWKPYKEEMTQLEISPFKEVKTFNLND